MYKGDDVDTWLLIKNPWNRSCRLLILYYMTMNCIKTKLLQINKNYMINHYTNSH
jgi:hypothetical protein